MKKKIVAVIVVLVLVFGCAVGGTLAWLIDTTGAVTNTFTYGDINITLNETTGEVYKMVPGNKIAKDPKVTVAAGSEACWLFVKIEKSENYDTYLGEYEVATGWTQLEAGVYYREANAGESFYVLAGGGEGYANGYVQVKTSVTKAMMNAIDGIDADGETNTEAAEAELDKRPTLTFTAYAVQKDNMADAATAWGYATGANT